MVEVVTLEADLQDFNVANMEQVESAINVHNLGMGVGHIPV